ncbi:MAG: aminoacyl-tRNA hydrolase [Deltaproteobacteria bacterium]|nr:aminoacyl-tRNA hydrolase [Deltaproteobacteria bacterium]MCL5276981.1 aminoacyl-tRNA hydrolase [Deltaproteobacteria bacterium]
MFGLHRTQRPALIIAGLGNPHKKYAYTRHNVGFLFLSVIEERFGVRIEKKRFDSLTDVWQEQGADILLLKPLTYMNLSGIAVQSAMKKYRLIPSDIIVVHDDMDLAVGRAKFDYNRSSAGHKGVESVIEKLGTREFYRIRIGIGKPGGSDTAVDYVLSEFNEQELDTLQTLLGKVLDGLLMFIGGKRQEAIEFVNKSTAG